MTLADARYRVRPLSPVHTAHYRLRKVRHRPEGNAEALAHDQQPDTLHAMTEVQAMFRSPLRGTRLRNTPFLIRLAALIQPKLQLNLRIRRQGLILREILHTQELRKE